MCLGESIAITHLHDLSKCFHENFSGFTLTKFEGEQIRVG